MAGSVVRFVDFFILYFVFSFFAFRAGTVAVNQAVNIADCTAS